MRKARILLILGTWVAIIPYTGFPYSWKDILTTISGLVLIYFSYTLYSEYKIKEKKRKNFDNFRENANFKEKMPKAPKATVLEIDTIEEQPMEEIFNQEL